MQQIEERAYLENKVDSILKPLVTRMFIENPTDHVSWTWWTYFFLTIGQIHARVSLQQPWQASIY